MSNLNIRDNKFLQRGWWLVPVSMFAIFCVFTTHVPLALDDFQFKGAYLEHNGGSSNFSLKALLGYENELRNGDNGRISNLMAPFSSTIEPTATLFPYISALMLTILMVLAARWSRFHNWRSITTMSLMWLAMVIMLPWHDTIFVADYSLNYIFSGGVTLTFISLLVRCNRNGWRWWQLVMMIPAAVVAGGWHEGFALPGAVGLLLLTFATPAKERQLTGRFGWEWWIVGLVYGLSAIAFALSPGMLNRAAHEINAGLGSHLLKNIAVFAPICTTVCIFIVATCLRSGRRLLAEVWHSPWFKITVGMAITSIIFPIVFVGRPRTMFLPNLCAAILLLNLVYAWVGKQSSKWHKSLIYIGIAAWILCLAQGCFATYWQCKYNREFYEIFNRIEKSDTGTVFYDVIMPQDLPILTMYMPPRANWLCPFQYECISRVTKKPLISVVPTALQKNIKNDKNLIPGTFKLRNIGNYYFSDNTKCINRNRSRNGISFEIELSDGTRRCISSEIILFINEDGDTLTYLPINRMIIPIEMRKPGYILRADTIAQ